MTLERTEQELVADAKAGDVGALGSLLGRFVSRLMGLLARFLPNAADREEIIQDTFLNAAKYFDGFDETRPIFPWLYRIALNLIFGRTKRVKGRPDEYSFADIAQLMATNSGTDNEESPKRAHLTPEQRAAFFHLAGQLPRTARDVAICRVIFGMSPAQTCEALDIPSGTAGSSWSRAKKKIEELGSVDNIWRI